MPPIPPHPTAVLDCWFSLERPGRKHDALVREALGGLYGQAARGELDTWAKAHADESAAKAHADDSAADGHAGGSGGGAVGGTDVPRGRLALILLLDQVPRHLFRGDPRAYATDAKAASLTAMFMGDSQQEEHRLMGASPDGEHWADLTPLEIFYATHPWLHAEDERRQARINPVCHRISPRLPGLEYMAAIADLYLETIRRFGRFPHRNAVLGRETTGAEARFLSEEWNQRRREARTCPVAAVHP